MTRVPADEQRLREESALIDLEVEIKRADRRGEEITADNLRNALALLRRREQEASEARVLAQRVPGLEKALSDECANSKRIVDERQEFVARAIKSWRAEAEDFERERDAALARLAAAKTALADVGNLSDEWEHSAELEVGRRQDDSNAKVAVYRMCARELRAAVLVADPAAEERGQ